MLPGPPIFRDDLVTIEAGKGATITWGRRGLNQAYLFGPSPLGAGEFERYQVYAYSVAAATALVGGGADLETAIEESIVRIWDIGDEAQMSPVLRREASYTNAEFLTDEFALGVSQVGLFVRQIGSAGPSDRSDIVTVTLTS